MKKLYKLIIFLAIFQFAVIIVNATNVFPTTLYSDIETEGLRNLDSPTDVLAYLFEPPNIPGLSRFQTNFTFGMLITIFTIIGIAAYRISGTWTPMLVLIICGSFIPMMTKSLDFFNKLFYNWDSITMTYLALCIGVGIIILAVITVLETPTHGDA